MKTFPFTVIALAAFVGTLPFLIDDPTESYTEVHEITAENSTLSLHTGCHIVDMKVSEQQVSSINQSENSVTASTHDLTRDILNSLDSGIEKVVVNGIDSGVYSSYIKLDNGEKIDSRPSDGVAVAVRSNTSVYIERNVLHQHEFLCENYI